MKAKRYTMDMDEKIHLAFKLHCVKNNLKMQDVIHKLVSTYLKVIEQKKR